MDKYPLSSECTFSFDLSTQSESQPKLKAWQLTLSNESDENKAYTFPDDLGPGFAGIVWTGNVTFDPSTPINCVDVTSPASIPVMVQLTACTKVELMSGDENDKADIAVIGIFETPPSFDDRLVSSGKLAFQFGEVQDHITALFRVLNLSKPGEDVAAVSWPRPAAILTTLDGPRPVGEDGEPLEADDLPNHLQLHGTKSGIPLSFTDGPERPDGTRETLAIVCDYYVAGDTPIEDGCRWRCWGGL